MSGERSRAAAFAVAALYLAASTSHAEEDYARTGWYAGFSGSYAVPRAGVLEDRTDNSMGVAVTGGYRLNELVGVEGEFEWLSGFEKDSFGIDEPILMTANAKGYAPIGRVQPWLLYGLGR